jgi:hypothetical protein
MTRGGGITTKVLMQRHSLSPVHGLLDRPAAAHGEYVSHPSPRGRSGCIAYVCQDLFPHIC